VRDAAGELARACFNSSGELASITPTTASACARSFLPCRNAAR